MGVIALILVLSAPAALGAPSRSSTGTSFGPEGAGSSTDFGQPGPIAVDAGLGAVYVADTEAGTVYKFDEAGTPSDFSASGSPKLEGFTFDAGYGESQLAVDPTTHALYVLSNGNGGLGAVEAFDASGAPREFSALGTSEILGAEGQEFCGVAVDAAGDLYVGDYYEGVSIYAPSGELIKTVAAGHPCNVAVDAESNLYANQWEGAVERLVPSSVPPTTGTSYTNSGTVGGAFARSVYADPQGGPVLIDEGDAVAEVAPHGGTPRRFGEGGALTDSEGVAYSSASGLAFVSDSASHRVEVFTAAEPLRPELSSPSISSVDSGDATVEVSVNPMGSATVAYFEYGTSPCSEGGCTETTEESVGAGEVATSFGARLSGLVPGTTYFLRATATNGEGSASSAERSFATPAVSRPSSSGCPNEALRGLLDRQLPDCRAYELVSPVDKEGADIQALPEVSGAPTAIDQSAPDGGSFTFSTFGAFASPAANPWISQYLSKRGEGGWTTTNLTPPREGADMLAANEFKFFTPDLSRAWVVHSGGPSLAPGGPSPAPTLYERDTASGEYASVNTVSDAEFILEAGSTTIEFQGQGGGHTVFRVPVGPSKTYRIFDSFAGQLKEVSVLPDGTAYPADSTVGGFGQGGTSKQIAPKAHAVSADGSVIYWTGQSQTSLSGGPIYARVDGRETVPVSEAAAAGDAQYWLASADGSHALFSFLDGPQSGSLFDYSLEGGTARRVCGELVGVVGGGEDLATFYFVSREALGGEGVGGKPNLYVDDEGQISLIATLAAADGPTNNPGVPSLVNPRPILHSASVSADGGVVVFNSLGELTGYDNRDLGSGEPDNEVFRYDAATRSLSCLSCDPSGARPRGREVIATAGVAQNLWSAAQVPSWQTPLMDPQVIADGGRRVFFDAYASVLPQDTNEREDVYEWEAPGAGTCTAAAADYYPQNGGCLSLISTGTDPLDSEFFDADPEGANVFFATGQSLVAADPGAIDVYDAREFGGFPEAAAAPAECEGDACQGSSAGAAVVSPAGSSLYSGPPNQRHRKKHKRKPARKSKRAKRHPSAHGRRHVKQGRKGK